MREVVDFRKSGHIYPLAFSHVVLGAVECNEYNCAITCLLFEYIHLAFYHVKISMGHPFTFAEYCTCIRYAETTTFISECYSLVSRPFLVCTRRSKEIGKASE